MKAFIKKILSIVTLGAVLVAGSTSTMAAGLMTPSDASVPALEIKSHHVNVTIEDGYAVTQVDQVFSNPNSQDMEATYSFPVPEKGAVSEFTVWIDGQPVIGEVLKKERAQQLYEAEKAAGREAGLTEKKEHYRFEVNVSPVRAKQDVRIRMVYLQAAHIDNSMGRYVYPLEEGQTDSQADAFWSYNPVVKEDFSFNVTLRSGYPVTGVRLPEHPAAMISNSNDQEWSVTMGQSNPVATGSAEETLSTALPTTHQQASTNNAKSNTNSGNQTPPKSNQVAMRLDKDIVMYWRLAPNLPGAIDLVTHREPGAKRGTFMMTITPGDDLS
ncbi:MAG: VIT domain-containing protein, partial [Leucothrix sp.]